MLAKIKNLSFVNVFWLFFYLLIFGLLLKNSLVSLDPDFGWHLKVGEEISLSGEIPRDNHYNYTYQGGWVDHEWLSDWAVYQVYETWGYEALVVVFSLIALLAFLLLHWQATRQVRKTHFLTIASLQLLGVIASLPHLGVRIQELALLLIVIILSLLWHYERRQQYLPLLVLVPLMFLWANLHASFLLGFFLLFSWLGVQLFKKILITSRWHWMVDKESVPTKSSLIVFLSFVTASLLATFYTPYRLELYSFLSGYRDKAYLNLIQEWLPQYIFPFHYNQILFLALVVVALGLYLKERWETKKSFAWWRIFLAVVFIILGIKSRRHFPLLVIVSLPLLLQVYSPLFLAVKERLVGWLKPVFLVVLFLAALTPWLTFQPIDNPFSAFCAEYPCGAAEFLRSRPEYLNDRVLNSYGWGGFLIYVLPEQKLFIDGRLPQVKFGEHTFIEEYFSFFQDEAMIAQKLLEHKIELVVIPAQDKIRTLSRLDRLFLMTKTKQLKSRNRLHEYLEKQEDWTVVYNDGVAKIYSWQKKYEN